MAKSLHAKSRKRARAIMRTNVGEKHVRKVLRKTTRRNLRALGAAEKDETAKQYIKEVLSGVNGASADLVTEAPVHKKKLRYTFNTALRQKRLEDELEDETDDEAEGDWDGMADVGAGAGAGAGAEACGEVDLSSFFEQAGVKKAPGKPLPKREMSASYYDWQNKDLAQPHTSGKYDASFDGQMGNRFKNKSKRESGKTTKHVAVGAHASIFERLASKPKPGGGR